VRVWIRRLELTDFRNFGSFVLEPDEGLTILVGPNAVGKTNVVEGVELVTEGTSFRNPAWTDVVRQGTQAAAVRMLAQTESGAQNEIVLGIQNGRRSYRVNGRARRTVVEVAGTVPAVVFTPDDLKVVKEGAERRRAALDSVGTQVSRAYGRLKAEYDRALRQRNALLREPATTEEELEPWTRILARSGAELTARRRSLLEKMSGSLRSGHRELSGGEDLRVAYVRGWERSAQAGADDEAMLSVMRARLSEERARRTSLVGPHKDDVRFEIEERDARTFASQGQQRSIALAWKLAELDIVEELSGRTPVLLLDDVMSELDEARRHALASRVGARTQTIITTTNLGYFDESLIGRAAVVRLPSAAAG
jgi:DNA replication and repair protein RecF